jgi:hypothetical protein
VSFLHPLALLGLAAAAIPALLHLLQRRTPPELDFPPLRYLAAAERASARRLKLRHLVLLLLRTALIVCVVVAAARPLIPARTGGAHAPTAVVVILDNSVSAGAVVDGRPVLDRLRVLAHTTLSRASTDDRVWLMLADGVIRGGSPEVLLAALDSARADGPRLDLVAAVQRAAQLVHAEPMEAREVHVLSDVQRTAVESGRSTVPGGVRVLVLAPARRPPPNVAVGQVRVTDGVVTADIGGTPGSAQAAATLRIGGQDVGRALTAPGTAVSLALPPLGPAWWTGELNLEPDELRADDRRLMAWRVAPPARVAAALEAGPFAAAALAVLRDGGRVAPGNEVSIADRPAPGTSIVLPPADPALVGPANRALGARGVAWRFGAPGTPGTLTSTSLPSINGVPATRRLRLEPVGRLDSTTILATVNGEPWITRSGDVVVIGSRLDTAWTELPERPGFVPFVDALVNRVARGEAPVRFAEGTPAVVFERRGADTVGATVYGADPREADLTPASESELRQTLGERAQVLDDRALGLEAYAGVGRADASAALILLALMIAVIETVVAIRTR